jgi:hypothetical protein
MPLDINAPAMSLFIVWIGATTCSFRCCRPVADGWQKSCV